MKCPNCDSANTVLVWEDYDDPAEREYPPDFVGCMDCTAEMTRLK